MSMKYPMTPEGIEPASFRFVAQHLNHCATAVPKLQLVDVQNVRKRIKRGGKTRQYGKFWLGILTEAPLMREGNTKQFYRIQF